MQSSIHLVLVTCPPAEAHALAEVLVRERVAACVNIVPKISSVYRWKNEIKQDEEALLIIKAAATDFEKLKLTVLAHHPYELPEIIAVNPVEGHKPYLDWILETCR